MKAFGKEFRFTTDSFEVIVTLTCTVVAGILGAFNLPRQIPVSIAQYVTLSSIIGFTVGYGVSSFLVTHYKNFKKRSINK